jgi:hypothetical protein
MPIDDAERKTIIQAIRTYIAKERISREEFAARAKLGKSTVDKLVVGIFSEKTILQIESQLNLNLRQAGEAAQFADEEFGKYTREDTKSYVGEYVFARPSFRDESLIHAFHMAIEWDNAARVLLVKERAREKKALQFGTIHIPRASMHIFILSNERGWLKSVILTQLDIYKRMKGIMLTMGHAFGNLYTPVAMPVVMNRYDKIESHMVGKIDRTSRMYEEYNRDLLAVEEDQFAKWIRLKPH